jgi:hypothetical protein
VRRAAAVAQVYNNFIVSARKQHSTNGFHHTFYILFYSSAFYSIGFPLDFFFFSSVSFINAHIPHSEEYFVPKLFWPRQKRKKSFQLE